MTAIAREGLPVDAGVHHRCGTGRRDVAKPIGALHLRCWRSSGRLHRQPAARRRRAHCSSGASPSASAAFLTMARVWAGVHRGAPWRSRQPAHLAGQPVVQLHDVAVAGVVVGLGRSTPAVSAQLRRRVVLVESHSNGPAMMLRTSRATGPPADRPTRSPGKDLHLDPAAGHAMQRALQDVDVHPASVASARLEPAGKLWMTGRRHARLHAHAPAIRKPRATAGPFAAPPSGSA